MSRSVIIAISLTFGLRIFYSVIGILLTPYLKLRPDFIYANRLTDNLMDRSDGLAYAVWGVWERFDTLWYLRIAEAGYDRPEAVVFHPLYPVLIKLVSAAIGHPLAAALLISTVSSFFLFWGFQKLLRLDLDDDLVTKSLIVFVAWPGSFIFFAGYPESLLLSLVIWSVYFARTGRWWWAGALGFFAGLTKAVGVLVVIPLAVLVWRERNRRVLPAVLALMALPAYYLWLKQAGLPLPAEAYPKYWGTEVVFPWTTLLNSLGKVVAGDRAALNSNLAILVLVYLATFLKRWRLEYTLYALGTLFVFLTKKSEAVLESTLRYVLEVFPAYSSIAFFFRAWPALAIVSLFSFSANVVFMRHFFEWSLDL